MSRRSSRLVLRPLLGLILAVGWLAAGSPLAAYIIYLKDGSQFNTKGKYSIEGDKAILTMLNGNKTFLDASEIDVARTEEVNKTQFGAAKLIEGKAVAQIKVGEKLDKEETLTDYLLRNERGLSLPQSIRQGGSSDDADGASIPLTKAGFLDLKAFKKTPYKNEEIKQELLRYLFGQGFENVEVFEGTQQGRVLLRLGCNSEALVFKALTDTATLLSQLQGRVAELEVLAVTSRQQLGGQFLMNKERAALLVNERLSPSSFFLRYVEF